MRGFPTEMVNPLPIITTRPFSQGSENGRVVTIEPITGDPVICITRVICPCFGIVHRNLGYYFSIIKISIIIKAINLKLNTLVESVDPVLLTR